MTKLKNSVGDVYSVVFGSASMASNEGVEERGWEVVIHRNCDPSATSRLKASGGGHEGSSTDSLTASEKVTG